MLEMHKLPVYFQLKQNMVLVFLFVFVFLERSQLCIFLPLFYAYLATDNRTRQIYFRD